MNLHGFSLMIGVVIGILGSNIMSFIDCKNHSGCSAATIAARREFDAGSPGVGGQNTAPRSSADDLKLLSGLKGISAFDAAADALFVAALDYEPPERPDFDLVNWKTRTAGGLADRDRLMLAKIYREADSVFEYGLGESTHIAAQVGVPRYSGIDSDPEWVTQAREKSLPHFRFYFADIGKTKDWGWPELEHGKNALNYQAAPLLSEPLPFDVYMVDGRWRVPLVALSFLHASAQGADHAHTKVLLHDCQGNETLSELGSKQFSFLPGRASGYARLNDILTIEEHSRRKLCVFKRKESTTNEILLKFWHKNANNVERRK